jgi:predicted nucleic acid-binding protein
VTAEIIYWDSDAFLGWFQEEAGKVDLCQGTLERARSGDVVILTSTLTLAEVLWMRNAPRITQDKADLVRRFFRHSYIKLWTVTRTIAEEAQDLVWYHSIRPKDAIHVATALALKCAALETFDDALIGRSGLVGNPPIVIRKPIAAKQGRLGFGNEA